MLPREQVQPIALDALSLALREVRSLVRIVREVEEAIATGLDLGDELVVAVAQSRLPHRLIDEETSDPRRRREERSALPIGAWWETGEIGLLVGRTWGQRLKVRLSVLTRLDGPIRIGRGRTLDGVIGLDTGPYTGFSGIAVLVPDGTVVDPSAFEAITRNRIV